jgi:hypothetical protein
MPGTIEDDDPGESPGWITASRSFGFSFRRPKLDVEAFIDRLRFMGVDPALVEEVERRLKANARRGMRWVEARLSELEPAREPPACDCGEPLVDVAWRGRATVRCAVCGSRWGVEVIDEETESLWNISGPAKEWCDAHPPEEYDRYGDFGPEDVVRDGLPALLREIAPGTYSPLATWQDDRDAAVLYVHRRMPGDFDMPGDEYEEETEHLVRDEHGEWMSSGSGGSNWVNVLDPPLDLLEKYVLLGTGTTGSGDDDGMIYFTGGLCSSVVAAVEAADAGGTQSYPIESDRPFFVVGIRNSGRVRILDADGVVVRGRTGEPLEFDVGD